MTLIELAMTIGLLSVVMVMLLTVLLSVQSNLVKQSGRSRSNDQARLAVEELDREIRSGIVFAPPANENDAAHFIYPGMSLRIYTQANAPTRETGGQPGNRCVQWRIKRNATKRIYELQRREWVAGASSGTNWQVIAEDVMNRSVSPQKAAFSTDPSQATPRIVNISILVNSSTSSGGNVQIDTSVDGRNTVGGPDVCQPTTYPTPDPAES